MRKFVLIFLGLLSLLFLSACDFSLASDITPPPNYTPAAAIPPTSSVPVFPIVPPDPSQGAQLYVTNCVPCHGTTGLGDGPQASNLPNPVAAIGTTDLARQSSPAAWFQIITDGNLTQFMPPFGGALSDSQRWDVLAYVYTLSAPDKTVADGKALFQQQCASCHGPQGKGDGDKAASLSTHPKDLTDQSLMSTKSATDLFTSISDGVSPDMPSFSAKLSEDQRWALTAYLRSLTFTSGSTNGIASAITPTAGPAGITPTPVQSTQSLSSQTPAATSSASTAPAPATTGSGTAGTITGKITFDSGAPTTVIPSGANVSVTGYDSMNPVVTLSAPVSSDGSYRLDNVQMPSGRVFMASITLNQITFNSDVSQPVAGATTLNLPIPIRATSADASVLSVDRMHIFLDFSTPGMVQVVELFIITNPTSKVVVAPPGQAVIKFGLPSGATNLQFQDGALGQRYINLPNGFGDTQSVPPGTAQHQVLFAYDLAYQGNLSMSLPAPLPVKAAVVLLPISGISIQSSQLTSAGSQNVQGTTFNVYTTNDIATGANLTFSLSGQPQSGSTSSANGNSNLNLLIGGTILVVALALAGWWLYRSGVIKRPKLQVARVKPAIEESPDSLIDAIITLDELHKEGTLPEAAYQNRRAELKRRLQAIYQPPEPPGEG